MDRRRGFTLIELLVVISIISVLMAILMPALSRVKDQARMTTCRSNLRNYALIGRMYSDDNGSKFPYSFGWLYAKDKGNGCVWHDSSKDLDVHPELAGVMWPYLKGQKINLCPTFATIARQMSCYMCKGATIGINPQYGYTMNSYLNGDAWASVPLQYHPKIKELTMESQVKEPARTFYFGEENSWAIPGISGAGINDNNLRSTPNGTTDCFATFHKPPSGDLNNGVSFAAFVDAHVEFVTPYPKGNTFVVSWPAEKPGPVGF
jgi:prepilin-type N-terminal cleavage/methylation domain-containing protein